MKDPQYIKFELSYFSLFVIILLNGADQTSQVCPVICAFAVL